MQPKKLYAELAVLVNAVGNCQKTGNTEWEGKHRDKVEELVRNHMPSGSGIDSGTTFDWDKSTDEKLVFNTSYHHMNEGGFYDGWTGHVVIVRPSLAFGFTLSISGQNRNDIKDYLHEVFHTALSADVPEVKGS